MSLRTPRYPERYKKYGEYLGIDIWGQITEINSLHDEILSFQLNLSHSNRPYSEEQKRLSDREQKLFFLCSPAISALSTALSKVPELDFSRGVNLPKEHLHLKIEDCLLKIRQLKKDVEKWWKGGTNERNTGIAGTEEIKEIDLLGSPDFATVVKVAHYNAIDRLIATDSTFTFAGNTVNQLKPERIIGVMNSIGSYVISIWELSEDGVYRLKTDIETTAEGKFSLTKRMPDGSERRVDLSIVL